MKTAVTGASGFIGTELLAELNKREGMSVIALTRDASGHEDSANREWRSTDYSFESLLKALDGADTVIHLAGVRGTENDPDKFAVNAEMTENILKAMAELGAKRIVFASTMSVYNDDSLMPWKEDAPLRGRSCYGDSKADCEELIRKYAADSGMTYGIARIAQVLGDGEKRRAMMNVFLDTAKAHGTLKVMGKSAARKHYIYVKDLARVLAILAAGNESFDAAGNVIVNVGMPQAYTNLEVAEAVNEVFGNPEPIEYDDSYPETGRPFRMDITRLKTVLGYDPLDMKEALTELKDHGRN
ncbi:MAG: NAD(P)-dependent oxidoreductase [Mogibacterium sp.]|nr:NAD(P)-dependent oxidoreductase [Mogibacterium sp.]